MTSKRPFFALFCRFAAGACATALLAAGSQAGAAAAIMPHLAVYKLSLGKTRGTGGVTHASGRIEFKWSEGCDGWTVSQRTHLVLTSAQGLDFESGWVLNAWESKDGLSYRFSVQRAHGDAAPEEVRGKAQLQALGQGGVVTYSKPEKSSLSLPSGTLFPTRYSEELIDAASRSDLLFWRQVFDGSAEDGLFGVNATLSRSLPADAAPSFDSPLIQGVESWRMHLAYFGRGQQQAEPDHEQGQRVYANGVVDELEFDYNDFAIKGALERLEALPAPDCR